MSKYTGGPAFPVLNDEHHMIVNMDAGQRLAEGMTLRDYFAAKALPAILAVPEDGIQAWAPNAKGGSEFTAADAWARNAYEIADAMLAARSAS